MSIEKAERLVELLNVRQNIDYIVERQKENTSSLFRSLGYKNPETVGNAFGDAYLENVENILKVCTGGYVKYYSEDEMDGFIQFLQTPAGQAFVEKQSKVAIFNNEQIYKFVQTVLVPETFNKVSPEPLPSSTSFLFEDEV